MRLLDYPFRAVEGRSDLINDYEACPIQPGQYIICTDSGAVWYDDETGTRVRLTDIGEVASEEERLALVNPAEKFWFVASDKHLWRYEGGEWYDLSEVRASNTVMSREKPEAAGRTYDEWLEILSVEPVD